MASSPIAPRLTKGTEVFITVAGYENKSGWIVSDYNNGKPGYYVSSRKDTLQNDWYFTDDQIIPATRKARGEFMLIKGKAMLVEGQKMVDQAIQLSTYDTDEEEVAALLVEVQESSDLTKAETVKKIAGLLTNRIKTNLV
jgi:hypothetical protein